MKVPLIFLFSLFYSCLACQIGLQEYIPNPDFEEYSECPTGVSNPGDPQIEKCIGWFAPTSGTSDYFNSCAEPLSSVSVGNIFQGYQSPLNGNGMCGFFTEIISNGVFPFEIYREYISIKLKKPLENGKVYQIRFYVNLANSTKYGCSGIGAYFSKDKIQEDTFLNLGITPQILNSNGFLSDTLEWVEISGEFVAVNSEEYLTIGNFAPIYDTLTVNHGDFFDNFPLSYYYIDGIQFQEKNEEGALLCFSPNDDGINDLIEFENFFMQDFQSIFIYNRWGNKIKNIEGDPST